MPGPSYALFADQGVYAEAFLKFVRELWSSDASFRKIIKNHYDLMKAIDFKAEMIDHEYKLRQGAMRTNSRRAPGKNDYCPCSSGKKYKKCCLVSLTEVEL